MNPNNKKRYTIIALIVVGVMILSPILYMITTAFSTPNKDAVSENQSESNNALNQITDENALKIIEIHKNLNEYKGKEVSMELQYFKLDEYEDKFSVGVIDSYNGEDTLFNILAETDDKEIPDDFENYDKVKVTGTIDSMEEKHEDHTLNVPIMTVKNMEKVEEDKEQEKDN